MSAFNPRLLLIGVVFSSLYSSGWIAFTWTQAIALIHLLAVCFCVSLYLYQDNLLYQPRVFPEYIRPEQNPLGYRSPADHSLPFTSFYITTPDAERLHCWFIRPDAAAERKERVTVLFLHANAGNMGFRLDSIKSMYVQMRVNVLILSYRGYGNSTGTPTEQGLIIDAEAVWKHMTEEMSEEIDVNRIVVFGRSLGGAVAIALAANHSPPLASSSSPALSSAASPPYVRALIVENTFASISLLVNTLFPLLTPLKPYLLRLSWNSLQRIASVRCPILFLVGERDEVVPASHMQLLYDAAIQQQQQQQQQQGVVAGKGDDEPGAPLSPRAATVVMHRVPTGMHNTTWIEGGQAYINAFMQCIRLHAAPIDATTSTSSSSTSTSSSSS